MTRTELIFVISAAFFLTFLMGWTMRWVYGRLNRVNSPNITEIDGLASRLHEAEEARDQAVAYCQQREWELSNQLSQSQAELAAAMEGLGTARREAEHYRELLEARVTG